MAQAIFLVGLPGAGKTRLISSFRDAAIFDDYKANAVDDDPSFDHGRRLAELLGRLRDGTACVISDIDFCRREAQTEAVEYLRVAIPTVQIEWWCFENDPAQCARNVEFRATKESRDVQSDLAKIREYTDLYTIPANARILSVWRPTGVP